MGSVVLVARAVLATVFAIAAVAKLLDRQGSQAALKAFGVPTRALPAAAVLLPIVELATAAALIPASSARSAAAAALVLLLAFIAAIAAALVRGEAPDCHCFGQLHSAPAGRGALVRNALLAAAAGIVVWSGPGPAIHASVTELTAVVSTGAAVLLLWTVTQMRRRHERLQAELVEAHAQLAAFPPGLPVGTKAPSFALASVRGESVTLEALCARGLPVALMFVSPDCGPCEMLFPELARWQGTVMDGLTIAVISRGDLAANLAAVHGHDAEVLLQEDYEVMRRYRVGGTPAMVVVTSDGRIASAPAAGGIMIESLVRLTLRRSRPSIDRAASSPQRVA